jgi:hypothetical protein
MAATLTRRSFAATSTAAAFTKVLGANDRIHLGIIGAGGRGNNHLNELAKDKELNAQVTAVCDVWRPNRERAVHAANAAWGAEPRATSNYEELLGWKDVSMPARMRTWKNRSASNSARRVRRLGR